MAQRTVTIVESANLLCRQYNSRTFCGDFYAFYALASIPCGTNQTLVR